MRRGRTTPLAGRCATPHVFGSVRVWGVVVAILAGTAVSARAALGPVHDSACGFSIGYPQGWAEDRRDDDKVTLYSKDKRPEEPFTWVTVGPITELSAGAGSGQALAQAAAGEYCLKCLSDTLVWMDRFLQDQMTISYTIETTPDKFFGQVVPYYLLRFFIFAQSGPERGAVASPWARADLRFYVPQANFSSMEQTIMDMVRSFKFTQPTKKNCKW